MSLANLKTELGPKNSVSRPQSNGTSRLSYDSSVKPEFTSLVGKNSQYDDVTEFTAKPIDSNKSALSSPELEVNPRRKSSSTTLGPVQGLEITSLPVDSQTSRLSSNK